MFKFKTELTKLQKDVMFHKSTERAFTGEYDNFYDQGEFVCRNCGKALFSSKAKFDAGCGWPAFDDTYPGAVKEIKDADGRRTEIVCANCDIHLGHVFTGEQITPKNTRHCVNSASIRYVKEATSEVSSIVVGCGCFWGVEHWFKKLEGVLATTVGYSGGESENPTYEQVCSGRSGHREVLKVDYDPKIIGYEELLKFFFSIHDFEQTDGQGNDRGIQYQSVIFCKSEKEKEAAEKLMAELTQKGYKVATEILDEKPFYAGEMYHRDYYDKNGKTPYCHFFKSVF